MARHSAHDVLKDVDSLLEGAAKLNRVFPDAVLVGGAAAAIHAKHRMSIDADFIVPELRERFDEILRTIEAEDEWTLARTKAPVLILGNFHGVETTLRQLIRRRPLETIEVETPAGSVRIPSLQEMIRIKAWLALTRNAYRDYLDLAALSEVAGPERTQEALAAFDDYYQDVDAKNVVRDVSPLLQLTIQLFEPMPYDLKETSEVHQYKGAMGKWASPDDVIAKCKAIGLLVADVTFALERDLEQDLNASEYPAVEVPDFPKETHKAFLSSDGKTVIVRKRDVDGQFVKVDNPLGPAVVSPKGPRFAVDGRLMEEEEWKRVLNLEASQSRSP